ncbi:MAG: alkaline phosphatase D family protein, partial [Methylococcales bacterium]
YGPLLDVFVLDMRSYRAGNSFNRQTQPDSDTDYLGQEQLQWLKTALKDSKAVWKVIAADLSLGLEINDGFDSKNRPQFENLANGDGPPLGREFEIAELLSFIKQENINNLVWFTAEVHYCAAIYYEPSHANFKNFKPFWEFISGPLNAGSFGTHALDNTFGPQIIFEKPSPTPNLSPLSGLQYFGQVDINSQDQSMIVALKDLKGNTLFTQRLNPA